MNNIQKEFWVYVAADTTPLPKFVRCKMVAKEEIILVGGNWNSGLVWAGRNNNLKEVGILEEDISFVEECIFYSINEGGDISGTVEVDNLTIQWWLSE